MGGGLLQLSASGKQDLFLNGNPQMTYWKQIYRRYDPFAIEAIPIVFDGGPDFGKRLTAIIPHTGDLLSQLLLEIQVPAPYTGTTYDVSWINSLGHALIEEVSIEINDKQIDKQNGEFMQIWSSLTMPESHAAGFAAMIGRVRGSYNETALPDALTLQIPLYFWFCRNPGLALPVIAMQRSQIRVNLKLRAFSELRYTPLMATVANASLSIPAVHINSCILWADWVFLGVEERRRLVENSHDYLIEQVQMVLDNAIPAGAPTANIPMTVNCPTSEIFWVIRQDRMSITNEWFNYGDIRIDEVGIPQDLFTSAIIKFDGQDRFKERVASYFRLVQPYQRHTSIPSDMFIYCYSFSLKPENAQPSGAVNMSRLNARNLMLNMNALGLPSRQPSCTANIYVKNYNILRIVNGLATLLFYV